MHIMYNVFYKIEVVDHDSQIPWMEFQLNSITNSFMGFVHVLRHRLRNLEFSLFQEYSFNF